MKKMIIALLAALPFLLHLACEGVTNCSNIAGDYSVAKTVSNWSATRDDSSLTIDNFASSFKTSDITITQSTCILEVEEDSSDSDAISYSGDAGTEAFSFQVPDSDELEITVPVEISGTYYSCKFYGSIDWSGEIESDDELSGSVEYSLTKHSDETKSDCPDTLVIEMGFSATPD